MFKRDNDIFLMDPIFFVVDLCKFGSKTLTSGVNISQNSPFFQRGKVSMFWRTREEFVHFERTHALSRMQNILMNILREENFPRIFHFLAEFSIS